MTGQAIELLEAAGFKAADGGHVIVYDANDSDRVMVSDAETGGPVTDATTKFLAFSPKYPGPHGFDLIFRSDDVRDMVAFGVAATNSCQYDTHGIQVDCERGFVYRDTFIHNPFADDQYGDWLGKPVKFAGGEGGEAYEIKHPAKREWADLYVAWRDAYCDRLLDPVAAPQV
jgi:hypothetical protein